MEWRSKKQVFVTSSVGGGGRLRERERERHEHFEHRSACLQEYLRRKQWFKEPDFAAELDHTSLAGADGHTGPGFVQTGMGTT